MSERQQEQQGRIIVIIKYFNQNPDLMKKEN